MQRSLNARAVALLTDEELTILLQVDGVWHNLTRGTASRIIREQLRRDAARK